MIQIEDGGMILGHWINGNMHGKCAHIQPNGDIEVIDMEEGLRKVTKKFEDGKVEEWFYDGILEDDECFLESVVVEVANKYRGMAIDQIPNEERIGYRKIES